MAQVEQVTADNRLVVSTELTETPKHLQETLSEKMKEIRDSILSQVGRNDSSGSVLSSANQIQCKEVG